MTDWISVVDALPPQKEDVLLIHILGDSASEPFLGFRDGAYWFETSYYCRIIGDGRASHSIPHDQITHWARINRPSGLVSPGNRE